MPYGLLSALIYIQIFGLIVGAVFYLTRLIPDATTQSVVRVVLAVILGIYILYWLLSLLPGGGFPILPPLPRR